VLERLAGMPDEGGKKRKRDCLRYARAVVKSEAVPAALGCA